MRLCHLIRNYGNYGNYGNGVGYQECALIVDVIAE